MVTFFEAIGLFFWQATEIMVPAMTAVTTSHVIYLPAKVEFVEGVRFGGAGGIAAVQIDQNLTAYRQNEKANFLHFLKIAIQPKDDMALRNNLRNNIVLDYYAKENSSTHVFHARYVIESIAANHWT